jgi:hypothetical protein
MLKAGIALVAALALTAVMASAASAQFTSSVSHTRVHGTQVGSHVFTAGEGFGGITCTTATFEGTGTSTNEASQTITPTYSNCKDSFGRTVDIDNGGLHYVFTTNGTVHVTGSMVLTVTSGGSVICTVTIKNGQTNTGIGYHNVNGSTEPTGTQDVLVTTESEDVISTTAGGFFNCGIGNGEHKNGTYEGETTMKGFDTDNNQVGISVHGNTEP